MTTIGGFIFLLACVFGGYIIAGGHMEPILHSLPYEMLIIGGAALGALVQSACNHVYYDARPGVWPSTSLASKA